MLVGMMFAYTANMTSDPKRVVQARLRALGWTQAYLAEKLGTSPAILSRTLGTPMVRRDSHWPAILEALDLQVAVLPRTNGDSLD